MHKPLSKAVVVLIVALFLSGMSTFASVSPVQAQDAVNHNTVGLWHLNEILPDSYQEVTPDASGVNVGILGGYPSPPALVEGKFDAAFKFSGSDFVYVPIAFVVGFPPAPEPILIPISPNLDIQEQVKIEAWINVQGYTEATYNNIVVKCTRTDAEWQSVSRVMGLSLRGTTLETGIDASVGALSGFVRTDSGGFNEIVTTEPVVTLNEWTHVAFVRDSTGMHLYVDGYEQAVKAIHGVQNPVGTIVNGTEVYIGHDSTLTIDEVHISDLAPETTTLDAAIDIGPNLLIAVVAVSTIFAVAWLLRRAVQMWVLRSK
ncbi:MAG: LamG domain-containing protein [Candidatus Bathyarchaeota archaeon]|nr:LamG domain-containing protein [Candidatus Bathyarchaeota archaeon]